jgi:hypothetical protein
MIHFFEILKDKFLVIFISYKKFSKTIDLMGAKFISRRLIFRVGKMKKNK